MDITVITALGYPEDIVEELERMHDRHLEIFAGSGLDITNSIYRRAAEEITKLRKQLSGEM